MSLSSLIARVGVSPTWITANAHVWFAYAVTYTILPYATNAYLVCGVLLAAAGAKEFWFDAKYEVPRQTFLDNAEDFLGYLAGVALAASMRVWLT